MKNKINQNISKTPKVLVRKVVSKHELDDRDNKIMCLRKIMSKYSPACNDKRTRQCIYRMKFSNQKDSFWGRERQSMKNGK
jgi:hypothetical protein